MLSRCVAKPALADQGGVSFWVPGLFGSLAASPLQPGFSLATIYYHTSVDASGDVAAAKQIEIGRLRPTRESQSQSRPERQGGPGLCVPSYVFDTKIFGGQFAVSMLAAYGRNSALRSTAR